MKSLAAAYIPKTMDIVAENGAYIKASLGNGCQLSVKVAFTELRGGAHGAMGNNGYEIYGDKRRPALFCHYDPALRAPR